MDREKFTERMKTISGSLNMQDINDMIERCLQRVRSGDKRFTYKELACMAMTEECAELSTECMSHMRKKTDDVTGILEESADVVLDILFMLFAFGIPQSDLVRAINVKVEREWDRIRKWEGQRDLVLFRLKLGDDIIPVTEEDVTDIMESALTGIDYWADSITVEGSSPAASLSAQIVNGNKLRFSQDVTEDTAKVLDLGSFEKGLSTFFQEMEKTDGGSLTKEHRDRYFDGSRLNVGMIDSVDADCIIQYALFDELVYA